jgi:DNA-binding response OmpR family regulator
LEVLPLRGRSILVVEDEPLLALDLETFLHGAGAKVLSACTLDHALHSADHAGLAAAVLDYKISANDCEPVCQRLRERRIPFIIYSAYPDLRQKFPDAVIVSKPADLNDIVAAISALL